MTDNDKAKSAKDRLEAAKKAAEDAEVVSEAPNTETLATDPAEKAAEASEAASDLKETVENGAEAAAEAREASRLAWELGHHQLAAQLVYVHQRLTNIGANLRKLEEQ